MKGLLTGGNGLSYTSPDVNKIIMDVVDSMPDEMDQVALVKKIYSMWLPEIEYGTARVSVNHSDGIATVSNTTGTHLSTIYSSYATPLAILASFAVPVFSKVTANANDAKNINNAKQLLTGCALYASDRGSGLYPESLDQLAEAGIIDAEYMARLIWQDPQTGAMEDWKYFEGLNNTQGSKILMASPRPVNGIRIVGMADGSSVMKMTEAEYQERLSRQ